MSRPKGPGAIKFLDVKEQGDVEMRRILFRGDGGGPTPDEAKLERLRKTKAKLTVKLAKLRTRPDAKTLRDTREQIRNTAKQIEETRERMREATLSREEKAAFPWHERAVFWTTFHKCLSDDPDADHTSSPAGSTITTDELQKQLRAEGFRVGDRELRRFMRLCGVKGQQGKRKGRADRSATLKHEST